MIFYNPKMSKGFTLKSPKSALIAVNDFIDGIVVNGIHTIEFKEFYCIRERNEQG